MACWNVSGPTGPNTNLLIAIAGNEANQVLAQEILLRNFKHRKLDVFSYGLWLMSEQNLTYYIWRVRGSKKYRELPGNDIVSYITEINKKHHSVKGITLNQLLYASYAVFLLNPVLYTYLWSSYTYLGKGQRETNITLHKHKRNSLHALNQAGVNTLWVNVLSR